MTEFEKEVLGKVDRICRVATYIFALLLLDIIGSIIFFSAPK